MRRPIDIPIVVTTEFGVPDSNAKFGRHSGIDYLKSAGSNVYAPTSGTLTQIVSPTGGNMVVIKDSQGLFHRLMHNSQFIKGNGAVSEGELVAKSGSTGLSTGPHVHWDINKEGIYPTSFNSFINPATWLEGGNMPGIDVLRIIASEVEGFDMTKTHKGEYDKILKDAWGSKPTDDYVRHAWTVQKTHRGHLTAQIKAKDIQIKALKAENATLKAEQANSSEANLLGQALIKLLSTFGYKKG